MLMAMAFLISTSVKAVPVNWLPWSVLKISGFPDRIERGCRASHSSRPPMVRRLFVVQMPDPCDERRVPLLLCPVDCFPLGFGGGEDMIRMVFDHVILDVAAFGPPFRSSLDVYVRRCAKNSESSCA